MDSSEAARPRRRIFRIAAIAAGPLAAVLVLALIAAVILLHDLARPSVKRRIILSTQAATGVQLDYRVARVELFSGVHLEGLVVRTPTKLQAAAPELLRVGSIDARWSLRSLLGDGPKIEQVSLRDLALTLVADDAGPTSLSELAPPPPTELAPAKPSPGLSRQLASLLAAAPPVGRVEVSGVALNLVRTHAGAVVDRLTLRGLAAEVLTEKDGKGWKLFLNLGQSAAPLHLELTRDGAQGAREAELELALGAELNPASAQATVDLDLARQTFDPRLQVSKLVHGAITARFDPGQHRIAVDLARTQLADGAELEAQLVLPDGAPPQLTRATADLDFSRLLRLVPAELVPFTLGAGSAHVRAQDVTLASVPQLGAHGELAVDAELSKVAVGTARLALDAAKLSVSATPDPKGGLAGRVSLALADVALAGATPVQLSKAQVELRATGLKPEPASPLRAAGAIKLTGAIDSLAARSSGLRIEADHAGFDLAAPLPAKAPFAVHAELPVNALRVFTGRGAAALETPVHLVLDASAIRPDAADPRRTRAKVALVLDAAGAHATLDADKAADKLDYELDVEAPELGAVRPLLPKAIAARAPWAQMALTLGSQGSVAALFAAAPRLDQRTELHVHHAGWDGVRADALALVLTSNGDAWKSTGDLDVEAEKLRLGKTEAGHQHLVLGFDIDRRRPALKVQLATRAGPKLSLDASLSYEHTRHALATDLTASASELADAAPLLALAGVPAALQTSKLAFKAELHGALLGVLSRVGSNGVVALAPEPLRHAGFEGSASLDASGIRWSEQTQALSIPSLTWRGEFHVDGRRRTVHSVLSADAIRIIAAQRRIKLQGIADDATARFTMPPKQNELVVDQRLSVHAVEQDPAVAYPIQDLALAFSARREPNGVIHLDELKLQNPAAKTQLELKGRLDLSNARRHLAMRGDLSQDLSTIGAPESFEGSGNVAMSFRVASPDLTVFKTRVDLTGAGVHVHLPGARVKIDGFDGQVPLTENLELRGGKLHVMRDSDVNLYSMLRFADQHPLIRRSGYVSVASITTPYVSIAPLAGNMSVNQQVFSLSQLEMGVRSGKITGQCVLDWRGKRSTFQADVRATGVQSSHGEPFDGNAAVVISAADRSIDGRAEILRIGNRHLLDLLDLQDPNHTDPALNRVRRALALGYPDHARVVFDHGFASATISFGGLAKLLSLDAIRGLPTGQLVDRLVESLSNPQEEP